MDNPWDSIAKGYDTLFLDDGDWIHRFIIYPEVIKLLGNIENKNVTDLGCATGSLSRQLAEKGAEVIGIDYAPEMIHFARLHNENSNKKIKYLTEDINHVSLEDNSQDKCLLVMVLQSTKQIDGILTESFRILKKGGQIVIVIPHPCFQSNFKNLKDFDNTKYKSSQRAQFTWSKFAGTNTLTGFYIRSLEYYFNKIRSSQLSVVSLSEPSIILEAKSYLNDYHTEESYNKMREFPSFLIFNCTKP